MDWTYGSKDFNKILLENHLKLTKEKNNINLCDKRNYSALILACAANDEATALNLIDQGIKVDIQNKDGWTALMIACTTNNENIVNKLIEHNAAVNRQNHIFEEDVDAFHQIYEYKKYHNTALHLACVCKAESIAIKLIAAGAEINIKNIAGRTAFDYLAKYQLTEVIEYLRSLHRNQLLYFLTVNNLLCECFRNPTADLNIIDIITGYYSYI